MPGRAQQGDVDLKRRIPQKTQQLRLRGDLRRHQIDNGNLQRAYVLASGAILGHDEDAFALKGGACGKIGGNLYGHGLSPRHGCAHSRIKHSVPLGFVKRERLSQRNDARLGNQAQSGPPHGGVRKPIQPCAAGHAHAQHRQTGRRRVGMTAQEGRQAIQGTAPVRIQLRTGDDGNPST